MVDDDRSTSQEGKIGKECVDKVPESSFIRKKLPTIGRNAKMPQELEDPDDCTVGNANFLDEDRGTTGDSTRMQELTNLPKEVRNLLAGGLAGMLAKSVVAPLDRIKILYQVSPAEFHFHHIPTVARRIIKSEGLSALWKGNSATMIRVFPYSGIQFTVFERCKTFFLREHLQNRYLPQNHDQPNKHGLTPLESLMSGMIAGIVSVLCTYPLDLTRTQLAVLKKHRNRANQGFLQLIGENYSQSGIAGLYRGITPTLLGILPYAGIAFTINDQGKREVRVHKNKKRVARNGMVSWQLMISRHLHSSQILHLTGRDLTTIERVQCGAFAGLVAQTVTYPIEVIRRRMQTVGMHGDTALSNLGSTGGSVSHERPSLIAAIRALYLREGVRGFFKGVSMNWVKGPVAFSISFTAFDIIQGLMESDSERALALQKHFSLKKA